MIRTFLAAALVIAFGCSKKSETTSNNSPSTIDPDKMGTFTCKDVQADACVGPTDRFDTTVPVVHVTYKTKDLPKVGEVYVIQWIAEDVGQAAPPNTVIGTLDEEVKAYEPGTSNYVVNSKLTKPTNGWPVGKYRVEIKRGDKLETTARFSIQ